MPYSRILSPCQSWSIGVGLHGGSLGSNDIRQIERSRARSSHASVGGEGSVSDHESCKEFIIMINVNNQI